MVSMNHLKNNLGISRLAVVSIDAILPAIHLHNHILIRNENSNTKMKVSSLKFKIFKPNVYCVYCGIKGEYFAVEKHKNQKKSHLNLYAIDKEGIEVLMTVDHILPKSKGGRDTQENLWSMCQKCNNEKADNKVSRTLLEFKGISIGDLIYCNSSKWSVYGFNLQNPKNKVLVRNGRELRAFSILHIQQFKKAFRNFKEVNLPNSSQIS